MLLETFETVTVMAPPKSGLEKFDIYASILLAIVTLLMYSDSKTTNRKSFLGPKYEEMLLLLDDTLKVFQKWHASYASQVSQINPAALVAQRDLLNQQETARIMGVRVDLYLASNVKVCIRQWIKVMNEILNTFNSAYEISQIDQYGNKFITSEQISDIAIKSEQQIKDLMKVRESLTKRMRLDVSPIGFIFRYLAWFSA